MHKLFYNHFFNLFFDRSLRSLTSAAVFTSDFEPLAIKCQHLSDTGTLTLAAQTSDQYLALNDGDMSIVNDPQCGNLDYSSITLTLAFEGKSIDNKKFKFFLASRISLKPSVQLQLNQSQLKIPPTPLAQHWELNEALFKGISEHPACPVDFFPRLQPGIKALLHLGKTLKHLVSSLDIDFSTKTLNTYLKQSQIQFLDLLNSEFPYNEVEHTFYIDPDIKVKVKIEHNEEGFLFNFNGTDGSDLFSLTDSMTLGACMGALLSFFPKPLTLNSGVLECVKVITPKNSLVKATQLSPTFWAKAEGTALIANFISQALWALKTQLSPEEFPSHGISQCSIDLSFSAHDHFYDTLESGSAAHPNGHGADALNVFKKSHLKSSVEKIEARFPIYVKSISLRPKSKGLGRYHGGLGSSKVYEVLEPAQLKWLISQSKHHPKGGSGGRHAIGSEIIIIRSKDKKKERLPYFGEISLLPHDVIIVHSPGGGGFGEEIEESINSL